MEKKIDERLKNLLNSRRTKHEEKIEEPSSTKDNKSLLIKSISFNFNLTDDNELNNFLKEKSLEVLNLQARTSLELGKIFTEVENKLAGNRYTGCYVKWLDANGYNKMTALRHKNRYKLYSLCSNDFSRETIAKISYKQIDRILKYGNPKEAILELEKTNSLDFLTERTTLVLDLSPKDSVVNADTYISNFLTHLPRKEVFEKLPAKKKRSLISLLIKIDRILNEVE